MMSPEPTPIVLHADQEHARLRTAVFILLFVTLIATYFAIRGLLGALSPDGFPDYTFVMSCGGAIPVAIFIVWVAEKLMKQYWPSGRFVALTEDGIIVQGEDERPLKLNDSREVVPLFWRFELRGWQRGGRERRVPRNWLCLAVELRAGKNQAIVYTYLSPQKAQKWLDADHSKVQFHEIFPREVYDNSVRARLSGPSRPEIPAAVLTGKNGNYWLAERRRWKDGYDLPPREFEQFMTHIQTTLL